MAEYIFIPSSDQHPNKTDLEYLIRHIGHDFSSDVAFIYQYLNSLSDTKDILNHAKSDAKHVNMCIRGITSLYRVQITLLFSPRRMIRELIDFQQLKNQSSPFTFNAQAEQPAQSYNKEAIVYMQLFNFIQNAKASYDREVSPIVIGSEKVNLYGNQLIYLGPNSSLYTTQDPFVRMYVKDIGKGIAKNDLPNVFEKNTQDTKSGVGLALADWICQAIHGFIKVESEQGKGSIFSLYFAKNYKE